MSDSPYGPPPPGGQPPSGSGNQPPYGQSQNASLPGSQSGPGSQPPAYGNQPPTYGQPPQGPGGQPPAYGQPPQSPGGQPPAYGQMPGQPGPYGAGTPQLASWGQRVGAYLIDGLVTLPAWLLIVPGYVMIINAAVESTEYNAETGMYETTGSGGGVSAVAILLILAGMAVSFGLQVWNRWIKGGKGQSIGKKVMGITLLGEATRQPIGTLSAFIRDIAHFLDVVVCNIGYLWPLWDDKRQTFSDKVMSTIVVQGPPPGGQR